MYLMLFFGKSKIITVIIYKTLHIIKKLICIEGMANLYLILFVIFSMLVNKKFTHIIR